MTLDVKRLAYRLRSVLDGGYLRKPRTVAGVLGDGTTTQRVAVSGSNIHVFFRPLMSSAELWEVRHLTPSVPRWHGWPVLCAYNEKIKQWEIAETDTDRLPGYLDQPEWGRIAAHAEQHIINEDAVGYDPVWVYRRAIVNLRPRTPPDDTMRIYVQPGALPFPDHPLWPGGYGPELSRYIPATAGMGIWATHYFRADGTLKLTVGSEYARAVRSFVDPPAAPARTVCVAFVAVENGLAALTESEIFDGRRLFSEVSATDAIIDLFQAYVQHNEQMWRLHIEGEL